MGLRHYVLDASEQVLVVDALRSWQELLELEALTEADEATAAYLRDRADRAGRLAGDLQCHHDGHRR